MRTPLTTAIFFCVQFVASADLTMVSEMTGPGRKQPLETTLYLANGNWRMESPLMSTLGLAGQDKYFVLNSTKKTYSLIKVPDVPEAGVSDGFAWENTGQKEKIAGYDAEKWVGKRGGAVVMEMWLGGPSELSKEFPDSNPRFGRNASQLFPELPAPLPKDKGLPLKLVISGKDESAKTVMVVTKLDNGPVDPKRFQLPEDYTNSDWRGLSITQPEPEGPDSVPDIPPLSPYDLPPMNDAP